MHIDKEEKYILTNKEFSGLFLVEVVVRSELLNDC